MLFKVATSEAIALSRSATSESILESRVAETEAKVVETLPMLVAIVAAKFSSSLIAEANSLRVLRSSGAPSTRLAIAVST